MQRVGKEGSGGGFGRGGKGGTDVLDGVQPTLLDIGRPGTASTQEPSPEASGGGDSNSPLGWGAIEAPFTIRINGEVETLHISLEDDADVKAQEFALAHNINITHEKRIAEQIRKRQLTMARTVVRKLDAEARSAGSVFRTPEGSPTEPVPDVNGGGGTIALDNSTADTSRSPVLASLTSTTSPALIVGRQATSLADDHGRPPKERIRELEEDLKDKEKELSKVLSRSVKLQNKLEEGQARLRAANNMEEQLKHANLQVEVLKERLEEIEAREAEWRRKAQEITRGEGRRGTNRRSDVRSVQERENLEVVSSSKSEEVSRLRRAVHRFTLDGTIQAALATAQRLSKNFISSAPTSGGGQKEGGAEQAASVEVREALQLKTALEDLLERYEALKAAVNPGEEEGEEEGGGKEDEGGMEEARGGREERRRRAHHHRSAEPSGRSSHSSSTGEVRPSSVASRERRTRTAARKKSTTTTARSLSPTPGPSSKKPVPMSFAKSKSPPPTGRRQKENEDPIPNWESAAVRQRIHDSPSRKKKVDEAGHRLGSEVVAMLQAIFVHYCGSDRFRGSLCLSLTRFHRLCKDGALVVDDLKSGDVDVAFRMYTGACAAAAAVAGAGSSSKYMESGRRRRREEAVNEKLLTFPNFIKALKHLSIKLYGDLIEAHVGRLARTKCDYSLAAGDAALDLLVDEKLTPFSKRLGLTGAASHEAALRPLGSGGLVQSKEGMAILAREEAMLRNEIFNKFSVLYQGPRLSSSSGSNTSNNHIARRRYMGFEHMQAALIAYDVVPKLIPIASVFDMFIHILRRDRKTGHVTSLIDGKQSEPPPEHLASFPQFVEIMVRIAFESFDGIPELTDMNKMSALFTWLHDELLKGPVIQQVHPARR